MLASTQPAASLSGALGLDWRSLLLYSLAFLVVAWLLDRLVFPTLIKTLDAKKSELETADRLRGEAAEQLAAAKESAMQIIERAHGQAKQVAAEAQQEATQILEQARAAGAEKAQRMVQEVQQQLARDIQTARRVLRRETADLVAGAAGVVLAEKLTGRRDADLIAEAVETQRR